MKKSITLYHVMGAFTLLLAIAAAVALSWHSVFDILKPKAVRVFLFGTAFMAVIAYGYYRDIKYREEEEQGEVPVEEKNASQAEPVLEVDAPTISLPAKDLPSNG